METRNLEFSILDFGFSNWGCRAFDRSSWLHSHTEEALILVNHKGQHNKCKLVIKSKVSYSASF